MKKILSLGLLVFINSAYADLNLRQLLLDKKNQYSVSDACVKALTDMPDSFQNEGFKAALVPIDDLKFDDKYFFHYTNSTQASFVLNSDVRDRADAHKKIVSEGGYKEILEYQMTTADATSNASGVGLYLAANPFSSMSYGSFQVTVRLSPKTKVYNKLDSKASASYAEAYRKITTTNRGVTSCPSKVIESLIYDENGADLVYFAGVPSEWVVLFNEDIIEASDIISLNPGSKEKVAEAMLINGNFEPLIPYFHQDPAKKLYFNFTLEWVLRTVSSAKAEYTYIFIDPTNPEILENVSVVISQKDNSTFNRHLEYLKSLNIDVTDSFLAMGWSNFSKGNSDFLETVKNMILSDPSILLRMTEMPYKLKFLISKNILNYTLLMAAKPNLETTNVLLKQLMTSPPDIPDLEELHLLDYAYTAFPNDMRSAPDSIFAGNIDFYFRKVTDLEKAKSFLHKIMKIDHTFKNVLWKINSSANAAIKNDLSIFYYNNYLTPFEYGVNENNIYATLKAKEDFATFQALLASDKLHDDQKLKLINYFMLYLKDKTFEFFIQHSMVSQLSDTHILALNKFVYQKGDQDLMIKLLAQPKLSIREICAIAKRERWGVIAEPIVELLLNEMDKNQEELKNLREGKDGLTFDFLFSENYPALRSRILEKYKNEALDYIQANFRSLPTDYNTTVLRYEFLGERFKTLPVRTQLDIVKSQIQLLSLVDLEKYFAVMELDEAFSNDLINSLLQTKAVPALLGLVGPGKHILAASSLAVFKNTLPLIEELLIKLLPNDPLLGILSDDKKIELLWTMYPKLDAATAAKLTNDLFNSFTVLSSEAKFSIVTKIALSFTNQNVLELRNKFFDVALAYMEETSSLALFAHYAHLIPERKFMAYMNRVLAKEDVFRKIYSTSSSNKNHKVLMKKLLSESTETELSKLMTLLNKIYPLSEANYTITFLDYLEENKSSEKRDLVLNHTENLLCKKIDRFQAIKEIMGHSDYKDDKQRVKDLREKYCSN
jgi:hypothetical protein